MSTTDMPKLHIGDLTAELPIIQGGMGVQVSLSGLASAVANEGGIGVIASVGIGENEPDIKTNYSEAHKRALKREIQKARDKTDGIIGVNVMVALTDFETHVLGAVEAEADLIIMGAGLPRQLPEALPLDDLSSLHTKFVPVVSSAKAAKIIMKYWNRNYNYIPEAIIVEGPKAGGHLGFKLDQIFDPEYQLEKIIPQVLETVESFKQESGHDIAVIAAGGIFTGSDIYSFIEMGAAGVQMATRFIATHECDAAEEFKLAHVNCREEDLMIIKSPVGYPGRAIRNSFLESVEAGEKVPYKCPWRCLMTCDVVNSPYCIATALLNAKNGDIENGFAFAGSNAYRTKEIVSVKELIDSLKKEYAETAAEQTVGS